MTDKQRRAVIAGAGAAIMLLAVGALLLPMQREIPGRLVVGWMLIAAGVIELGAVSLRGRHRKTAAVAAVATVLAGLRLAADASANFSAVLNMVILWLVVRGAALLYSAARTSAAAGHLGQPRRGDRPVARARPARRPAGRDARLRAVRADPADHRHLRLGVRGELHRHRRLLLAVARFGEAPRST